MERFCTTQDSSDYLPASAFDALENSDHLVTFTGASSTTMAYGITQSKEQSQAVSYSTGEQDTWEA